MKWAVVGSAAVAAVAAVQALLALFPGVPYDSPFWLLCTFIPSAVAPFLAARETRSVRIGVIVGALVGVVGNTVGWAIAWVLGPGAMRPLPPGASATETIAFTVAGLLILGLAIGFVAGLVGRASTPRGRMAPGHTVGS